MNDAVGRAKFQNELVNQDLGWPNSLLKGSENQRLPAVPFREPLRHPVGHALQVFVLQRVVQNAGPS